MAAVADADGRFALFGLSAGAWTLVGFKPGYVQLQFERSGRPKVLMVGLRQGDHLDGIDVELAQGAVISGTVRDESGRPIESASVSVLRLQRVGGQTTVTGGPWMSVNTDDRGRYRIYALPAGIFTVAVSFPPALAEEKRLTQVGSVLMTAAAARPNAVRASTERAEGFAAQYLPGVSGISQAETVQLKSGQEVADADVTLRAVSLGTLRGTVFGENELPRAQATVLLVPGSLRNQVIVQSGQARTFRTDANGVFVATGLAPDSYVVSARSDSGQRDDGVQESAWAMTEVAVASPGVTDLRLVMSSAARLVGHVSFVGSVIPPADVLARLRVTLVPVPQVYTRTVPAAEVSETGDFDVRGVPSGRYRLAVFWSGRGDAPPWVLESVKTATADVTDRPFEVSGALGRETLVVRLTTRAGKISGTVSGANVGAFVNYSAVAFPTDSSLWFEHSRFIRSGTVDAHGNYSIVDLPSGSYCLALVQGLEAEQLADVDFLRDLAAASVHTTLDDGDNVTVNLAVRSKDAESAKRP